MRYHCPHGHCLASAPVSPTKIVLRRQMKRSALSRGSWRQLDYAHELDLLDGPAWQRRGLNRDKEVYRRAFLDIRNIGHGHQQLSPHADKCSRINLEGSIARMASVSALQVSGSGTVAEKAHPVVGEVPFFDIDRMAASGHATFCRASTRSPAGAEQLDHSMGSGPGLANCVLCGRFPKMPLIYFGVLT